MAACWTWRANLLGVILVVAAASFAVNVLAVHAHPAAVFYLPVTRLWELSLGGLLACASVATLQRDAGVLSTVLRRYCTRPQRVREIETAFGALLIAVAFVELNRLRAFPGVWALLPAVGTFLVISAGPDAWINRRLLSGRAVVFVGLISFPLYLWHWPLLSYARIRSIGPPPVAWKTGAVIAAFLLASLTYWLIELPIRSTSGARLPRLAVALSLALGVVAAGGVWTDAGGGAPGRFAKVLQQVTNYKYDYAAEYREGRCFLMPGQSETAFGADCADPVSAKPMVFLWGDSHGAHLYPGLRRLQRERTFGVAQFTASGCPPLLGAAQTNRPLCAEINQSVFARIRSMKPAVVLLSAWWLSYPDVTALAATVAALKQAGVGRIVLVGPVPNWDHTLPEVLVAAFTRDPRHRVPTRTSLGLMPSLAPLDRSLRATAGRLGITYVSALDVFCNVDGCLVRTGDQASDLVAWDASHLTAVGSQLLVSAVVSAFADVLPGPRSQG